MITVTQWFYAEKPKHKGVYERDDTGTNCFDGQPAYSYWDGDRWSTLCSTVTSADCSRGPRSEFQDLPWRGLAVKP